MIRPSTHPAEQYRRARTALAEQLATVMHLLGHLDPVDRDIATGELAELLDDIFDELFDEESPAPRSIANVDTGGRL